MPDNITNVMLSPIQMLDLSITGIAKSIDKTKIQNWATDLLKKDPNTPNRQSAVRDSAFDKLVNTKAATNGVISGLAGLAPGVFSIPAAAGKLVAQWTMKAQVAYSVACLYGKRPGSPEAFATDIYAITAGDALVKEAVGELDKAAVQQIIEKGMPAIKAIFNNPTVQKKLCEKIGEKMVKKIAAVGAAFGAAKAAHEMVGPLTAFKDAFDASADIKQFGQEARDYYFMLPNPFGIYVSARFGAALDFASSGEVKVRPRFPHPDGLFTGDIRMGVELGKGKYERNKGAITFSLVSWEKSMYNAPRPIARHPFEDWDFINVEPNLSNKVCHLNLTGEERFYGHDTINGQWERVDPPRVNLTIRFEAAGGTPGPANKVLTSGSAYGGLPNVTKAGFDFGGWWTSADGGTKVESSSKVDDSHTLYARWTAVPQVSAPKPASPSAPVSSSSSRPSASYGIGETGPGGGIVFTTGKECTYRDIGGGKLNYEQASKAPKNFNEGGKSDWRLPTKQELILIYENLYKKGIGNFQNDSYVSGTVSSGFVYAHNFASDTRNDKGDMNAARYVRAVRSF